MDARQERGIVIAATSHIKQDGFLWAVPSQSCNRDYHVCMDTDEPKCTCPDHETRGVKCKHIFAVECVIQREDNGDGTETVTETVRITETVQRKYTQDWPAYNAAQTHEKEDFQKLLSDLCSGINEPSHTGRGRPRIPLATAIFSAAFKVYIPCEDRS